MSHSRNLLNRLDNIISTQGGNILFHRGTTTDEVFGATSLSLSKLSSEDLNALSSAIHVEQMERDFSNDFTGFDGESS